LENKRIPYKHSERIMEHPVARCAVRSH